jgi:hypothetical protein
MTDKSDRVTEAAAADLSMHWPHCGVHGDGPCDADCLVHEQVAEALTTRSHPGEDAVAIVREIAGRRTTRETLTGIVGEAYLPANGASEADRLILRARAVLNDLRRERNPQ